MISLFVGGHAGTVQGEREDLEGLRMFSAVHKPERVAFNPGNVKAIIDSGAFTDSPEERLTPEQALDRQLRWETKASEKWGMDWQSFGLVSYDLLIDETWLAGKRIKRRWTVDKAETAVRQTIAAAQYLAGQRERLSPRKLVLSAQGVDAIQYAECSREVLRYASPDDWFGLGGWCIIGRQTSLLPEFWRTLYLVLPMVEQAGLSHVHIFGVLYLPALGGLLYLADEYGLTVSTDSTRPVISCTWKDQKRAGVKAGGYWRDEVKWWQNTLNDLRESRWYKKPPQLEAVRQKELGL